jgi:hypothetical protein
MPAQLLVRNVVAASDPDADSAPVFPVDPDDPGSPAWQPPAEGPAERPPAEKPGGC